MKGIGADLDAGTDLAELRGLFDDDGVPAFSAEPAGRREAADTAAGDKDGEIGHVCLLVPLRPEAGVPELRKPGSCEAPASDRLTQQPRPACRAVPPRGVRG